MLEFNKILEFVWFTKREAEILLLIYMNGETTVGELWKITGQAESNIRTIISKLEKLGLITRKNEWKDRRRKPFICTKKGKEVAKRIEEIVKIMNGATNG